MKILSAAQMREVDRLTTERYGIPSLLLMENAGLQLLRILEEYLSPDWPSARVGVFCGKGNNGGDGLVLARHLLLRGAEVSVYLLAEPQEVGGDAAVNLEIYRRLGGDLRPVRKRPELPSPGEVRLFDVVVDALLGTGLSKPVKGLYRAAVELINGAEGLVLSVDIPSGLSSDSLEGGLPTVRADVTVTFTAPKIAHVLNEDLESVGDLHIVPIGTPDELLEKEEYFLNLMTEEEMAAALPDRPLFSHKGTYGHVAVVAGSTGKAGAAALTGKGALRAGAGLVTICTPGPIQELVSSFAPELMTEGLPCTRGGHLGPEAAAQVLEKLQGKDALALGPGLGTREETVSCVLDLVRESPLPVVIDADGLNALAGRLDQLANRHGVPLVLTPHPGEFGRLLHCPASTVLKDRVQLSRDFALRHRVWLVLKGFRTLVATPSGEVYVCPRGNPGMASAGMGDLLTGVLASLLGQYAAQGRKHPAEVSMAVCLGVYLHALAGDLAEEECGPEALTAGEVLDYLGSAFQQLASAQA